MNVHLKSPPVVPSLPAAFDHDDPRRQRAPASRFYRPAARLGHGAHGARSHARLLRLEWDEPARRDRPRPFPHAVDHPLLRADLHSALGRLRLSLRTTWTQHRGAQPVSLHARLLADGARVHHRAARLDIQSRGRPLRHAGDLGDRRIDGCARRPRLAPADGDRRDRPRHDCRSQPARRHQCGGLRLGGLDLDVSPPAGADQVVANLEPLCALSAHSVGRRHGGGLRARGPVLARCE